MARLFLTEKEIHFINDITKEFVKDVLGQVIHYYPVSVLKTQIHSVYNEAVAKIFENPIKLDVLVANHDWESKQNVFGTELSAKFEIVIQARDLLDKGIDISPGDFFTYGSAAFEIQSCLKMGDIYGQEEYDLAYKIVGRLARPGTFDPKEFFGPENHINNQKTFQQQRGLKENNEGATGDVRQVRDRLGEEMAEVALGDGPRTVQLDTSGSVSSFYNE